MCGACNYKNLQCTFSSLPGLTRTAALKSEVSQLKTNNGSLIELYWQLKHGSVSDAYAIVEQIRSEEGALDIQSPAGVRQRGTCDSESIASSSGTAHRHSSQQSTIAAPSEFGKPNSSENSPESYRSAPLSFLMDVKARESYSQGSSATTTGASVDASLSRPSWAGSRFAPRHNENSDTLLRHSLQSNMDAIRKGFEVQWSKISELFYCYEPKAFEELFENLDRGPEFPISSPILCEICAVAVTAGQYVRDLIEPGVLDYWYGMSPSTCTQCSAKSETESLQMLRDSESKTVLNPRQRMP